MNAKDYEAVKIAPDVPFDLWLKKCSMDKVLCRSRLSVKVIGEDEWLEVVITITNSEVNELLRFSGRDGASTKICKTTDSPEEPLSRVVWLGIESTLSDAIEKTKPVESRTLGLEVGRRGLGIRVSTDHFKEVLPVILPNTLAGAELKKQTQKIYEMSKAPHWIAFEQPLQSFKSPRSWEIELVRVMHRFGVQDVSCKSFQPSPKRGCDSRQTMDADSSGTGETEARGTKTDLYQTDKHDSSNAFDCKVARRTSISKGEKQPRAGSRQQAGFTSSSGEVGGNQSLSLETTIRQFMRDMASGLNDLQTRVATVESKREAAYEAAVEYSMDTGEELSELSEIDASTPRKKMKRKVLKY